MIFHYESARNDRAARQVQRANLQVIDILAPPALEMIVVPHAGALVASLAVGEDDRADSLRLEQQIERPVNGRDPEAAKRRLRAAKDLLDGNRTLRLGDGLEDGITLAGMTLAERVRHTVTLTAGTISVQGKQIGPQVSEIRCP